jgi:predicted RNA-binding protein YlxR (DUF448 family)
VGCREVLSKRELLRLVRTEEGVMLDPSGKMNGRGAYIHDARECWEKALKGSLEKALHTSISVDNREKLIEMMNSFGTEQDA